MPNCPLCGARSQWLYVKGMRPELHNTIPDMCKFCKEEDYVHEEQWREGIDVTQFGGGHITERRPHSNIHGRKIA